jgi:hypothetical protein
MDDLIYPREEILKGLLGALWVNLFNFHNTKDERLMIEKIVEKETPMTVYIVGIDGHK